VPLVCRQISAEDLEPGECTVAQALNEFGAPVVVAARPYRRGHRLLELLRGGETAFLEVPAELEIRRTDVGDAYGLNLDGGGALPVRLTLDGPSPTSATAT
jgi:hypothetical protein